MIFTPLVLATLGVITATHAYRYSDDTLYTRSEVSEGLVGRSYADRDGESSDFLHRELYDDLEARELYGSGLVDSEELALVRRHLMNLVRRKGTTSKSSSSSSSSSKSSSSGSGSGGSSSAAKKSTPPPAPKAKPTQDQIAQKKADGAATRDSRQKTRQENADRQTSGLTSKHAADLNAAHAKPNAGTPKQSGTTRSDRQDMSKPSTGKNPTNNGGTTHTYNKATNDYMSKQGSNEAKMRADAERVVGESLRHPNNPITQGRGPEYANSVLRSDVHRTPTTGKIPGLNNRPGQPTHNDIKDKGGKLSQNIVTSIQSAPGSTEALARHLPVIRNPKTGEAHYDPRQGERKFTNANAGNNAAPAEPWALGPSFTPGKRSLMDEDEEYSDRLLMARALRVRHELIRRFVDLQ